MSGPEARERIETFFAATNWRKELEALRAILLDCGLSEDFKWRSPCYTVNDGNVATLWGFKEDFALSFFKGVLLTDRNKMLVAPGDNSRSVRMARFVSLKEVVEREDALRSFILEAMENEKAGLKVDLGDGELDYPAELTAAFEADPKLQRAFEALTPGRRRGYLLTFLQARKPETRTARIEKHASRILEGKGLHDRP
ncbi:hypothetical protein E2A64_16350 [Pseudohoeflea suaedae]|uniref:YdhG-like domain-containing protein n=1 Tax=Pseudohoeflea suaedae TaxID=877384 RepID=A0A4R5PI94_9HYPH|nr:YdeI/OmpD-associated family protein [Pseudohoeflea suaedae]TDH34245.1 hypothetical protein E2A64_16350 [Pseudohoeflea suaedae]